MRSQNHYWSHAAKESAENSTTAPNPNALESPSPTVVPESDDLVVDLDGSLGFQDEVEKDLDAVAALPERQAEGKMKFLTASADVAQKALDSLKLRAGALVEGHPELKFRILLMGKQGNGKTTLCNRVLGIDLKVRALFVLS